MNKQEAINFFKEWKAYTKDVLALLAPKCDHTQEIKIRSWDPSGKGGPRGVLYHYTGGPDGIASTRWANENSSNMSSSWHATVMDHRYTEVDHLHYSYELVHKYLPVTALFIASLDESTWHGNWSNAFTFGIENRNLGLLTEKKGAFYRSGKPYTKDKHPVLIRDQWWEPYTQEQLIANINIGRALRALQGKLFTKNWVLPHSAVWCDKLDTGLAYPFARIRDAIFSKTAINKLKFLDDYLSHLPTTYEQEFETDELYTEDDRFQGHELNQNQPNTKLILEQSDELWLNTAFYELGYHVSAENFESDITFATTAFQKSTHAPKWKSKHGALKVDSDPGKKTMKMLEKRLNSYHMEI